MQKIIRVLLWPALHSESGHRRYHPASGHGTLRGVQRGEHQVHRSGGQAHTLSAGGNRDALPAALLPETVHRAHELAHGRRLKHCNLKIV